MHVRTVRVNRLRNGFEALNATRRRQYIVDPMVVNEMPKGHGDVVDIVFFKPDLSRRNDGISDGDLVKEYEFHDLIPADPFSVVALNEAERAFADEKPHGILWKNAQGKWCSITFYRYDGHREVRVDQGDGVWVDIWWCAGFRK